VALKAYFDGSQTDDRSLTLAAIIAEETVWAELAFAWDEVLNFHGVPYSHMTDIAARREPFGDLEIQEREALLNDFQSVLSRYGEHPRIRQFTCSVDLYAHWRFSSVRKHPPPDRLATRILFPTIVKKYPGLIETIDLCFDQNEPFMTHLREDWQNRSLRQATPFLSIVRTIVAADMWKTIPLQVADMFAWARNRLEVDY
jgi:hypothetical protein